MTLTYRQGTISDLQGLNKLALKSWTQYQQILSKENWEKLYKSLIEERTFSDLLKLSKCFICTADENNIIGMAFLIPKGNPTDIYDKDWCYIRFVSVDPDFCGQGIGRKLTTMCINDAKLNGEKVVALHTSEFMNNARHIYENLGFKVVKEIDKRLGKRYWLYNLDLIEE
ncbi:GNAT family N-acetyltransferase [Pontibacter pamirensis]|uniref:GNAT family N-acetyltransferase n=1 Tax=Pontibacter pamirensis TaxID=2562824 RepID=UPI00138A43AF|nr:GNAT family N-acetyltransferase [Pontibacter pamirensis]